MHALYPSPFSLFVNSCVVMHLEFDLKMTAYSYLTCFLFSAISKDGCIDCELSLEQALHDALMRQEELLAYIDSQEEAKLRVMGFVSTNIYLIYYFVNGIWGLVTDIFFFLLFNQKKKFCW